MGGFEGWIAGFFTVIIAIVVIVFWGIPFLLRTAFDAWNATFSPLETTLIGLGILVLVAVGVVFAWLWVREYGG